MSQTKIIHRRDLLKMSLAAIPGIAMSGMAGKALANVCLGKTPVQPEGPFYPVNDQLDKNNDLTWVEGKSGKALGQIIYIEGQVMDINCNPLEHALVEIWQACESGRYDHPQDPNEAPLDPNFQYWGTAYTDKDGRYIFKTILPGKYQADETWMRPPHIHYKISKLGYMELITQMYFAGDALNSKDLILKRLKKSDQDKVIVELKNPSANFDPTSKVGTFNIVMEKV